MKPKKIFLLILVIVLSIVSSTLVVASEEPVTRPKIGLALGGGSALGFTHIGVLKWLEENHIPVDNIAGTSMGGLIGGFYAMGMSPAEIETLIKGMDWDRLFDSKPPFNALDFRRKEDKLDYPGEIEFGLRDAIFIPNGISAYRVDYLLSRLTLPYSTINSFNELPIPYRCVATDLKKSERVVLQDGLLSQALRATMSIPGAFTPVEINGQILVDGGLLDNVPADVVQSMGSDIIIAVNCNQNNKSNDMRKIVPFLMSAINTVLIDNTNRSLRYADCVIHPEVGNLSFIDWKAVDEFIKAGYLAAAQQSELLKQYQVDDQTWQEYLENRSALKRNLIPVPEGIEIIGVNEINEESIRKKLQQFIGRTIDPTALETALTELMGSGLYECLNYNIIIQNQIPVLYITAKEKSYGPPFIGAIFQTSFVDDQANFNLGARMTSFNVVGPYSELRTDMSLGTDPALSFELYKPVFNNHWFLAPKISVEQSHQNLFEGDDRINDFQVNNKNLGCDIGYNFNKFSELRVGYEIGDQTVDTIVGPTISDLDGPVRQVKLRWSYYCNTDNQTFTESAFICDFYGNWYQEAPGATEPFTTAEAKINWIVPVNDDNSFFILLAAGDTVNGQPPLLQQFSLGGTFQMGVYYNNQLRGPNYCLGTIGLIKNIGRSFGMNKLYLGTFLENGSTFADWSDIDFDTDLSVGLLSPTMLGSLYLGTSINTDREVKINLLFGRFF